MTAAAPYRVRISEIPSFPPRETLDPDIWETFRDGIRNASIAIEPDEIAKLFRELPKGYVEPFAVEQWSALVDAAVEEIIPQVGELLVEAIRRRLPMEWEGPELYRFDHLEAAYQLGKSSVSD